MLFVKSTCHHVPTTGLFLEQASGEERPLDPGVLKHTKPYSNNPCLLLFPALCGVAEATLNLSPLAQW